MYSQTRLQIIHVVILILFLILVLILILLFRIVMQMIIFLVNGLLQDPLQFGQRVCRPFIVGINAVIYTISLV